jgi:hypothetical protein
MSAKNKYLTALALIVWAVLVSWGWMALSRYENTPGRAQAPLQHWPSVTKISRTIDLPTMVIFLHPHCPCSRATIAQLSVIMAHSQNKVRTHVVFVKLPGLSQDWVQTDLFKDALRIPGVQVMTDENGTEARAFHAQVSGQVMLYDRSGALVFNGGITSSRGHQGDNEGQDAIIGYLTKGVITKRQTPFFGCFLFNDQARESS